MGPRSDRAIVRPLVLKLLNCNYAAPVPTDQVTALRSAAGRLYWTTFFKLVGPDFHLVDLPAVYQTFGGGVHLRPSAATTRSPRRGFQYVSKHGCDQRQQSGEKGVPPAWRNHLTLDLAHSASDHRRVLLPKTMLAS